MSRAILKRRDLLIAAGVWLVSTDLALALPSMRRRLKLKNQNTGESFDGLYRDETGPIPHAMADLRALLRDHHANKQGPVEIGTLDFLADVMEAIGQSKATILSAYRTPATNAMLRASGFDVAEKSQHLLGRALDVSFEARLADAERAARRMQRGGVGWYPYSHFVHLDTGPTRYWESDGSGLEALLSGRRHLHRPTTVAERNKLRHALARRDFLLRKKSGSAAK